MPLLIFILLRCQVLGIMSIKRIQGILGLKTLEFPMIMAFSNITLFLIFTKINIKQNQLGYMLSISPPKCWLHNFIKVKRFTISKHAHLYTFT